MRALHTTRYGGPDVLEIHDNETMPTLGAHDVLIQVHASPITAGDRRLRAADYPGAFMTAIGRLMFGVLRPRNPVQGSVIAGRVVAVGDEVTRFAVGDDVFGGVNGGAWAEYVAVPESKAIARMPVGLSYEEAAALPYGAGTALTFLRDIADVQAGEEVLIVGAAGGVGRYAVQVAKHRGARVTAVSDRADFELVRALGADAVVDRRSDDFTRNGRRYDVIFDTPGVTSYAASKRSLTPRGRFVTLHMSFGALFRDLFNRLTGGHRVHTGVALPSAESIERLGQLADQGAVRPVVAVSLPLDRAVEAHTEAESRAHHGEIILTMEAAPAALRAVA